MWKKFGQAENRPSGRWGFSAAAVLQDSEPFVAVWGGLKDGAVLDDLHVFQVSSGRWQCASQSGDRPSPRWGASFSASPVPGQHLSLVMLGGREGSKPMPMSEYFVMDLKSMNWTRYEIPSLETARRARPGIWNMQQSIHGVAVSGCPKNRYIHAACSRRKAGQVVVFGGHGGRQRYFADVGVLQFPGTREADARIRHTVHGGGRIYPDDVLPSVMSSMHAAASSGAAGLPVTASGVGGGDPPGSLASTPSSSAHAHKGAVWLPVTCSGGAPDRRSGHASACIGDTMVISGGYTGRQVLADVWCLAMGSLTWTECRLSGVVLPPLMGHSCEPVPGSSLLVVFGGITAQSSLSVASFLIDTETHAAACVTPRLSPVARFWHRCIGVQTADSNLMLLMGGAGSEGTALRDMYALTLDALDRVAILRELKNAGVSAPAALEAIAKTNRGARLTTKSRRSPLDAEAQAEAVSSILASADVTEVHSDHPAASSDAKEISDVALDADDDALSDETGKMVTATADALVDDAGQDVDTAPAASVHLDSSESSASSAGKVSEMSSGGGKETELVDVAAVTACEDDSAGIDRSIMSTAGHSGVMGSEQASPSVASEQRAMFGYDPHHAGFGGYDGHGQAPGIRNRPGYPMTAASADGVSTLVPPSVKRQVRYADAPRMPVGFGGLGAPPPCDSSDAGGIGSATSSGVMATATSTASWNRNEAASTGWYDADDGLGQSSTTSGAGSGTGTGTGGGGGVTPAWVARTVPASRGTSTDGSLTSASGATDSASSSQRKPRRRRGKRGGRRPVLRQQWDQQPHLLHHSPHQRQHTGMGTTSGWSEHGSGHAYVSGPALVATSTGYRLERHAGVGAAIGSAGGEISGAYDHPRVSTSSHRGSTYVPGRHDRDGRLHVDDMRMRAQPGVHHDPARPEQRYAPAPRYDPAMSSAPRTEDNGPLSLPPLGWTAHDSAPSVPGVTGRVIVLDAGDGRSHTTIESREYSPSQAVTFRSEFDARQHHVGRSDGYLHHLERSQGTPQYHVMHQEKHHMSGYGGMRTASHTPTSTDMRHRDFRGSSSTRHGDSQHIRSVHASSPAVPEIHGAMPHHSAAGSSVGWQHHPTATRDSGSSGPHRDLDVGRHGGPSSTVVPPPGMGFMLASRPQVSGFSPGVRRDESGDGDTDTDGGVTPSRASFGSPEPYALRSAPSRLYPHHHDTGDRYPQASAPQSHASVPTAAVSGGGVPSTHDSAHTTFIPPVSAASQALSAAAGHASHVWNESHQQSQAGDQWTLHIPDASSALQSLQ